MYVGESMSEKPYRYDETAAMIRPLMEKYKVTSQDVLYGYSTTYSVSLGRARYKPIESAVKLRMHSI